jgi:Icc protein
MSESLTFVHFSDTHIIQPGVRLRDVDTNETLTRVVQTVNGLDPQPAFVVIGGDLVSPDIAPEVRAKTRELTVRDYERSYETFHSLVSRLNVPVHYVMGNHDRRVPFRRVIQRDAQPTDQPHYYAFTAGHYRVCILDSLEPRACTAGLAPPATSSVCGGPHAPGRTSPGRASGHPCARSDHAD